VKEWASGASCQVAFEPAIIRIALQCNCFLSLKLEIGISRKGSPCVVVVVEACGVG